MLMKNGEIAPFLVVLYMVSIIELPIVFVTGRGPTFSRKLFKGKVSKGM